MRDLLLPMVAGLVILLACATVAERISGPAAPLPRRLYCWEGWEKQMGELLPHRDCIAMYSRSWPGARRGD
jgi:hypothetical protein